MRPLLYAQRIGLNQQGEMMAVDEKLMTNSERLRFDGA